MFDHEGPSVISMVRDIIVGVHEHIETTSVMDIYLRIYYTERILREPLLKKI